MFTIPAQELLHRFAIVAIRFCRFGTELFLGANREYQTYRIRARSSTRSR
jgi:hypothetical protein